MTESAPLVLDFVPVPLRARVDGWAPERQRAFIAALRETRSVVAACARVGLSRESAYKLYRRADAAGFRAAWDSAMAPPGLSTSRTVSTSAAAPPPPRPRAPFAAVTLWPVPPAGPAASCQPSTSSTSSTSAAPPRETNGNCQTRQLRELPAECELPSPAAARAGPGYSLEAFRRIAARARRGPQGEGR